MIQESNIRILHINENCRYTLSCDFLLAATLGRKNDF